MPTRLPRTSMGPFEHARRRERAGGLDHELHALPEEAHRLDQLRVGHGDDVVHVLQHEREA